MRLPVYCYVLLLLLFLENGLEVNSEGCQRVIIYGTPIDINGIYVLDGVISGRDAWRHKDKELYLFSYYGVFWVINTQRDGSGEFVLYKVNSGDYPYDITGTWDHPYNLKVNMDCLVSSDDYTLKLPFKCDSGGPTVITDSVSSSATQIECEAICEDLTDCLAYTMSADGCLPMTRRCILSMPEDGATFYKGLISLAGVNKTTHQSSTAENGESYRAVDGNTSPNLVYHGSCTHTNQENLPWWILDLEKEVLLHGAAITNRQDCCGNRLHDFVIGSMAATSDINAVTTALTSGDESGINICARQVGEVGEVTMEYKCDMEMIARYLIIYIQDTGSDEVLTLCEVQPFTSEATQHHFLSEKYTYEEAERKCSEQFGGFVARIADEGEFHKVKETFPQLTSAIWVDQQEGDYDNPGHFVNRYHDLAPHVDFTHKNHFGSTSCTASSNDADCINAMDPNPNKQWAPSGTAVGSFIKFNFEDAITIYRIRFYQRWQVAKRMKEIKFTFSDGTEQTVILKENDGYYIDDIKVNFVTTTNLKITIMSVYGTKAPGILKIYTYGDQVKKVNVVGGACPDTGTTFLQDTTAEGGSDCLSKCRKYPDNCEAVTVYFDGPDKGKCLLKSSLCADPTEDRNAATFYFSDDPNAGYWTAAECHGNDLFYYTFNTFIDAVQSCQNKFDCYSIAIRTDYAGYNVYSKFKPFDCGNPSYNMPFKNFFKARRSGLPNYVGCFKMDASFTFVLSSQYMTPDLCIEECSAKNYLLAALQYGNKCFCGNSYGTTDEDYKCELLCPGTHIQNCGGGSTMSIYHVNVTASGNCTTINNYDFVANKYNGDDFYHYQEPCQKKLHVLCERVYDHCQDQPCLNGGNCTSLDNGYVCECLQGFTGNDCETNINECESSPCQNGAQCIDGIYSYLCICLEGYTGELCDTEIDECSSNPCRNGATCVDFLSRYDCTCALGFTGTICETNIDDCWNGPCANGATCVDLINEFSCTCPPGFQGELCEENIDECASVPCQNAGTCQDNINAYYCNCPIGYGGTFCERELKECASYPCQNGATCDDLINEYVCLCNPGFTGVHCETDIDECGSAPCVNNGRCTDLVNGFSCECLPGFGGQTCQTYIGNPGDWTSWSNWTECSRTCQIGVRHRERDCEPMFPELGLGYCNGANTQSATCFVMECPPVDGAWGDWYPVSECSASCGPGMYQMERSCNSPPPQFGGENCTGIDNKWAMCLTKPCPELLDCSEWSEWSACTSACGPGTIKRSRLCSPLKANETIKSNIETNTTVSPPSDTNGTEIITEIDNEPQEMMEYETKRCYGDSCQDQSLVHSCYSCENTFKLSAFKGSLDCDTKEDCASSQQFCTYTYTVENKAEVTIKRGCSSKAECTAAMTRNADKSCDSLLTLAVGSLYSLGSEKSSTSYVNLVLAWKNLNSSCTVCCEGMDCNIDILPDGDSVLELSSSVNQFPSLHLIMSAVMFLICIQIN